MNTRNLSPCRSLLVAAIAGILPACATSPGSATLADKMVLPEDCPKGTRIWCDSAYARDECYCVDDRTADGALRRLGIPW